MQYRWNNGDTITPTKLNRIENMLESIQDNMIVTGPRSSDYIVLSTLFDDIKNCFLTGKNIIIILGDTNTDSWSAMKIIQIAETSFKTATHTFSKNQTTGYPQWIGLL